MVKLNKHQQEFLNAAMSSPEALKSLGLVEEEEPPKPEDKQQKGSTKRATEQRYEQSEQKRKQANSQFVVSAASGALNSLSHLLAGEIDDATVVTKIKKIAQSGDTTAIQEMLTSQALTLQAMFNYWVMVTSKTKEPESMEAMAHLALKSQEQCRRTLQTLADVKSPKKPSQFIKNYVAQQLNQLQMEQQSKEKIPETFPANKSNELLSEAANGAPVDIGR